MSSKRAEIGGVTGRLYTKTRVRGFAPWFPQGDTSRIVERVKEIIAEYDQALTIRQIFYRLVGKYNYEKTELAYGRLCEYMNRARRAGVLSFDAFRDDGDVVPSIPGWSGPDEFWANARAWAKDYFHTPDGEAYVEVWVETAGMAPQIQAIADPFGVRAVARAIGSECWQDVLSAVEIIKTTDTPSVQSGNFIITKL